jgi:transposase
MEESLDFQRRQNVGALLGAASAIKKATFIRLSRAAVSKVMAAYTNHGKTSSAKRNSGRKPKLSERDRRTLKTNVSKNHRTTAAKVTAELNIHPEDSVSTKQYDESFTNPTSTV